MYVVLPTAGFTVFWPSER